MIDLVIFDLDGVLVDACEWHRIALNKALKEVSNYEISDEDHYSYFNGIPTRVKLRILLEKNIIKKEDLCNIENLKQIFTKEIINDYAKVRPEKIEVLKYLKDKNIKIACYTNSIKDTADLMLKKTGIFDLFDLIITNQDVINPKPDPEGYLKILELLKIKKSNTIIIEDSQKGFEAAYLSGCKVFKVNNQEQVNIDLFKGFV